MLEVIEAAGLLRLSPEAMVTLEALLKAIKKACCV